jgi:hypothetical protein
MSALPIPNEQPLEKAKRSTSAQTLVNDHIMNLCMLSVAAF